MKFVVEPFSEPYEIPGETAYLIEVCDSNPGAPEVGLRDGYLTLWCMGDSRVVYKGEVVPPQFDLEVP